MQSSLIANHQVSLKKLLIIDGQPIYRSSVRSLIAVEKGWWLIGETSAIEEGMRLAHQSNPDLILLGLKHSACIEALKGLRLSHPNAVILMLADIYNEQNRWEALNAGASDFLSRRIEVEDIRLMLTCLHDSDSSEYMRAHHLSHMKQAEEMLPHWAKQLSKQEYKVLALLATGKCNKLIARELDITEGTVKVHLKKAYKKMNCRKRSDAVQLVLRNNVLHHFKTAQYWHKWRALNRYS